MVSATTFCFQISNQKNVPVNSSADGELRNIRRHKDRDRYAKMPLDKKVELDARKRENYYRRKV